MSALRTRTAASSGARVAARASQRDVALLSAAASAALLLVREKRHAPTFRLKDRIPITQPSKTYYLVKIRP